MICKWKWYHHGNLEKFHLKFVPHEWSQFASQLLNTQLIESFVWNLAEISSLYKHPIELPVNRPFIYCVVDRELDLAIIMVNIFGKDTSTRINFELSIGKNCEPVELEDSIRDIRVLHQLIILQRLLISTTVSVQHQKPFSWNSINLEIFNGASVLQIQFTCKLVPKYKLTHNGITRLLFIWWSRMKIFIKGGNWKFNSWKAFFWHKSIFIKDDNGFNNYLNKFDPFTALEKL
jgi:hypothetical protein